jgi:hypothetical protein
MTSRNEWGGWFAPSIRLFSEAEVVPPTDNMVRQKGAYWNKLWRVWYSAIAVGGRRKKYLGMFRTSAEAAAAFERAARERDEANRRS